MRATWSGFCDPDLVALAVGSGFASCSSFWKRVSTDLHSAILSPYPWRNPYFFKIVFMYRLLIWPCKSPIPACIVVTGGGHALAHRNLLSSISFPGWCWSYLFIQRHVIIFIKLAWSMQRLSYRTYTWMAKPLGSPLNTVPTVFSSL